MAAPKAKAKPAKLTARTTHLEMLAPPPQRTPMPLGPRLAVMRARQMPPSFYRYLYEQVGKPHHWLLRRNLDDAALAAKIHAPETQIQVLYVEGSPAGFFELDLSRKPAEVEIVYFGLTPDFQGRGLAKFFLSEAVFAGWAEAPEKLIIHTNTLDSPRALQLYQRIGFSPYAYSVEKVEPWV
jgi:GNAT superfamily N-acetyltransferase